MTGLNASVTGSPSRSMMPAACSYAFRKSSCFRYFPNLRLLSFSLPPGAATYGRWA